MPETTVNFTEILVAPVAAMIKQVGLAVAEAQKQLDAAALQTQTNIRESDPELAKIGYQVTWFQMPEVQVELKVAVHYEESGEGTKKTRGIFLSPFNAKYKNSFAYDSQGSSTLKLRFVPIPPPAAVT